MRRYTVILFALCVYKSVAFAIADTTSMTQDSTSATLSVESPAMGVKVFIDNTMVGTTPLHNINIVPGGHILTFVHSNVNNWLVPALTETISVNANEHVKRAVSFPVVYHITSDPYGAEVRYNDSLIGRTPFMFSAPTGKGVVVLSKEGYENIELPLTSDGGVLHAVLVSKIGKAPPVLVNGEQMKSMTPVYLSSGAAIISGTVAAYFKIKADGYYNDYRNTGDEEALRRVRKFDSISGVALVTSEISLLKLSYFLLSR